MQHLQESAALLVVVPMLGILWVHISMQTATCVTSVASCPWHCHLLSCCASLAARCAVAHGCGLMPLPPRASSARHRHALLLLELSLVQVSLWSHVGVAYRLFKTAGIGQPTRPKTTMQSIRRDSQTKCWSRQPAMCCFQGCHMQVAPEVRHALTAQVFGSVLQL